jgi:hypothetical protein
MSDGTENGQSNGAFFLSADDAKSLGNIDYMRTAKTVKKTFPGMAGREGFETVEIVSNQEKRSEGEPVKPKFTSSTTATNNGNGNSANAAANGTTETNGRRSADSSMDMFRNMAKDIRKKV